MSKPGGLFVLVCTGVALGIGGPTVVAESTGDSRACSDECAAHWSGPSGIDVRGRADELREDGTAGTYIWHNSDGWHLRVFDPPHAHSDFRGSIVANGGRFTVVHGNAVGGGDSVSSDSAATSVTYSLSATGGNKGVDFRVSGGRITFSVINPDGSVADRNHVFLGDDRAVPPASAFSVTRDDEDGSSGDNSSSAPSTASGGAGGAPRRGSGRPGAGTHSGAHRVSHRGIATHPRH